MQLLQYLWDIAMSFLSYLGLVKPNTEASLGGLEVYIKTQGKNMLVSLESNWTIFDVKQLLATKLNIEPGDVKIIFAGKELADSVCIEDCDLGQHSILHAVNIMRRHSERSRRESEDMASESMAPMCKSVTSLEPPSMSSTQGETKGGYFYVFCNSCKKLCSGKLRVRCGQCRSGAFTVLKDPCCWNDVLKNDIIPGICDEEECSGGFAEFYFRCAEHVSQGENDESVPLYLIKNNTHQVSCLVCSDITDLVLVFECESAHVICVDCFIAYCLSRLNDRQFVSHSEHGYTLPCAAGCPNSLILETHHFRLIGQQQYERYQRFGAEEFVLQQGGVLCPQPGCGMGIIPEFPDCNRISCRYCNFVFCRLCLDGFHVGECNTNGVGRVITSREGSFAVIAEGANTSRWDEASRLAIRVMTKPCPNCRTPTERNGGCMHMECTRSSCQFHWCWICQTEWKRTCMADHWFG